MRLILTEAQAAEVLAVWKPGFSILGRIARETFDAALQNQTSGRFYIEGKPVADAHLPALRAAFSKVTTPKPKKPKPPLGPKP